MMALRVTHGAHHHLRPEDKRSGEIGTGIRALKAMTIALRPCFCTVLLLGFGSASGLAAQQPADQYSEQARRALAEKNWPEAQAALEKLAQLTPGVPEVHANLGLVYYSQGRLSEAAHSLERALKLNPKLPQARVLLGLCDAESGRNAEAVTILEPAFRRSTGDGLDRLIGLDLERARVGLGDYAGAAAIAEELLKRYPKDPEVLFEVSRLYAGRSYNAMLRLVETEPDSAWNHYANAEVHASLNQYDLALREYRAALEREPNLPGIHYRIGRTLLEISRDPQNVKEALREFERELAVAPENADAEYEIGEIARSRGEFEEARAHFSKAVQYQLHFAEAQIGLARTLLSLDQPREAVPYLQGAIRSDPGNPVPHFILASAHKALGDPAGQREEMELFQKLRAASQNKQPAAAAGTAFEVTPQTLDAQASEPPN
jgi:tetratricopeptide (TPR) repeat protein